MNARTTIFLCVGMILGIPLSLQAASQEGVVVTSRSSDLEAPSERIPIAYTPYSHRFSLDVGDQAGGPVRYNTRFPSGSVDPNPASYYHTQAYVGASWEWGFARGALQLGGLVRRDLAHRGIEQRNLQREDGLWSVKELKFSSEAVSLGWIFGRMYREAPWKASVAGVVDRTRVSTIVRNEDGALGEKKATSDMLALSMRGRTMWRIAGSGLFDLHIGPEVHVPLYNNKKTTTDPEVESWLGDLLELKSTAAIGIGADVGIRF